MSSATMPLKFKNAIGQESSPSRTDDIDALHRRQTTTLICFACLCCISRESNPGHIDGDNVFYH